MTERFNYIMPRLWTLLFLACAHPAPAEPERSQMDVPGNTVKSDAPNAWRILFIGDSITHHGTNDAVRDRLGWDHVSGMAASEEARDYAHILSREIQALLSEKKVELYFHSFGGNGRISERLRAIDLVRPVAPHLVVIQLGEHERPEDGLPALRNAYRLLITSFNGQNPRPVVLCVGPWSPPAASSAWFQEVEDMMRQVCRDQGVPFVSVDDLAKNESCRGWGTTIGVQWHPNDKGHAGYAEKLLAAFIATTKSTEKTPDD